MSYPKMHVSIYVSDITESVLFYNAFFGQMADKIKDNYARYTLKSPALVISFIENREKVQAQFGHLGFQVEHADELLAYHQRVKNACLPTRQENQTNCCYALQDKFWVSDPDGFQWEVYHFHKDVEFNDPHYSQKNKSTTNATCC